MSKVKAIRALVRIVPKLKDTFYSFEYTEEREVDAECMSESELEKERVDLWDTCFNQVAEQIQMTKKDLGLR